MQLVATLALLLGGIYALYCLGRAASGLDRLASAAEEWVSRQSPATGSTPGAPGTGSSVNFAERSSPATTPSMPARPLTPPVPGPLAEPPVAPPTAPPQ